MLRRHWRHALALAVSAPVFLAGCGGSEESASPTGAPRADHQSAPVRELYQFDSIPVMVATADLVAVGTVTDVREGQLVGDPEAGLQLTEVTLRLGEVMKGDPTTRTIRLEIDDATTGAPSWLLAGEQSVFFLQRKTDGAASPFRPVNGQAIYHVASPDGRLNAVGDDPFARQVAAHALAGLRTEVRQAKEEIAAGKVKAQEPSLQRARGSG
jgi:hypothetical protein